MILDFKNHQGQWYKEDKMASIGKLFWNRDELMVLADVEIGEKGVRCVVGDKYGNLRSTTWQHVAQGDIITDYTKKMVSDTLIDDAQGKYAEHIRTLCAYLNAGQQTRSDEAIRYEMLKAEAESLGFEILWREVNGKLRVYMIGGTEVCG